MGINKGGSHVNNGSKIIKSYSTVSIIVWVGNMGYYGKKIGIAGAY